MTKNNRPIIARFIRKIYHFSWIPGTRGAMMFFLVLGCLVSPPADAAINIPITVNLSETVDVTGTPHIPVDVGGVTRYASYTSGTGTNTLTFTLAPQPGDVDLDGVTVSSPIDLNGGAIKDTKGNDATLTFTPPNTTNVKVNYPSLSLDFTYDADGRYTFNGTAYNDLSSFLAATGGTFSRSGTGTYFDSAGVMQTAATNSPRFDFDPITHTPKGILIEEARKNLLTYSDQFNNVIWSANTSTISPNVSVAPDSSNTADEWISNAGSTTHYLAQPYTQTSGTIYTLSVWVKSATGINQTFKLFQQNLTATSNITATPQWQRFTFTNTATSSATLKFGLTRDSSNNAVDLYVWGAQLETGPFPTSYIPTTSTTVTRNADLFTIPTTGGWFNAATGSFLGQFEEASALNTGGTSRIFGTSLSGRFAYRPSSSTAFNIYDGTNAAGSTAQPQNSLIKISSSYGPAGLRISSNGTPPGTATFSGTWGNQGYAWVAYLFTGHVSKYKYYPSQVSTPQLQLLSQ
ncbi:MAG: hypothetical protein JNL76_06540 [Alphaproteobacteria bacterium]|nr:hypothetical protein [Alphaproteobacteria bacterium]